MKQSKLIFIIPLLLASSYSQAGWQDTLNQVTNVLDKSKGTQLGQSEIVAGLKEALAKGVEKAVASLGKKNGFLGNQLVQIDLPDGVKSAAKIARGLGQGKKVDSFIASMNRAAEQAVPNSANLLGDAIRKMSVADGMKILNGGDTAATDYFRKVSSKSLKAQFLPIVKKATDKVGVTQQYKQIAGKATGLLGGFMGKSSKNTLDLDRYVTNKSLDGLYKYIAIEEKAIRANPMQAGSKLLAKVFGGK